MTVAAPQRPLPRADVHSATMGEHGLLYDPVAAKIHRLNSTGMLVWQCCDGRATVEEIAAELADAFDEPVAGITGAVRDLVAELDAALLLEPRRPEPATEAGVPMPDDASETAGLPAPPDTPPLRTLGPYAALDVGFIVECHHSESVTAELARTLAPLAAPADRSGTRRWIVWTDGTVWHLDAGGRRLQSRSDVGLVGVLLWHLNRTAIADSGRYLILHAGCVGRDGEALAMPAVMNSGKSTLTTLLVQAGYCYLTDEATAIDLDTGDIVAFPKSIALDPGTQELLPHLQPESALGPQPKWHIAPDDLWPGAAVARLPLRHLVFPTHAEGADNRLVPLEPVDAVIALAPNAFNLAAHAHRLGDIVEIVGRCSAHTLRHDGVDGPVQAMEALW